MAAWIVRHDEALLEAKRTLAEAIQEYGPGMREGAPKPPGWKDSASTSNQPADFMASNSTGAADETGTPEGPDTGNPRKAVMPMMWRSSGTVFPLDHGIARGGDPVHGINGAGGISGFRTIGVSPMEKVIIPGMPQRLPHSRQKSSCLTLSLRGSSCRGLDWIPQRKA